MLQTVTHDGFNIVVQKAVIKQLADTKTKTSGGV